LKAYEEHGATVEQLALLYCRTKKQILCEIHRARVEKMEGIGQELDGLSSRSARVLALQGLRTKRAVKAEMRDGLISGLTASTHCEIEKWLGAEESEKPSRSEYHVILEVEKAREIIEYDQKLKAWVASLATVGLSVEEKTIDREALVCVALDLLGYPAEKIPEDFECDPASLPKDAFFRSWILRVYDLLVCDRGLVDSFISYVVLYPGDQPPNEALLNDDVAIEYLRSKNIL